MLTVQKFPFNPLQENTYVIANEQGDCIIVDPGCYFGNERNELKEYILESRLQPKYLLNTHAHFDHIFGNKFIAETYGLQPYLHELDKLIYDRAKDSALNWGFPFDPYTGDLIFLRAGDTVRLGSDSLSVLFTPGHSPGHVSFYCKEQAFVVSGDVLFRQSIGRTDLPGGDFDTLIASIRTELFTMPDETVVYSGHGPDTTIGYEKKHNPFLVA